MHKARSFPRSPAINTGYQWLWEVCQEVQLDSKKFSFQRPQARLGPEPKMENKNHLSYLPVLEDPPDHQAMAWQFHLTQTQLVACDIRQSAG